MMRIPVDQYQPLGTTGVRVPPIMFGTCAPWNSGRPMPEQTRASICSEWFRHVSPPVFIDVAPGRSDSAALQTIGQVLKRLDVESPEVVIHVRLTLRALCSEAPESATTPRPWEHAADSESRHSDERALECWENCARQLGRRIRPELMALEEPVDDLTAATSSSCLEQRDRELATACRALGNLKSAGKIVGVGVVARHLSFIREVERHTAIDWIMLDKCLTIMNHPAESLECVAHCLDRDIGVLNGGVFHEGYLTGGTSCDGQLSTANDLDRNSLTTWRKSFLSLCQAYGVAPAVACIEFARSAPDIAAVRLDTSQLDRVAENVAALQRKCPPAFWGSMKEEGLVASDYPYLG